MVRQGQTSRPGKEGLRRGTAAPGRHTCVLRPLTQLIIAVRRFPNIAQPPNHTLLYRYVDPFDFFSCQDSIVWDLTGLADIVTLIP